MRFAKLHGLGNDFLLLDLRAGGEPLPPRRAVELCDRHLGIGADGVLTLLPGGVGSARDGRSPEGGALGGVGSARDGRSPEGGASGGVGSARDGRSPEGGALGGAGSARDGRSPEGGASEVRMLVQNADGSVPEMCGNGARCVALWLATDGCTRPSTRTVTLLTDAGPRPCDVTAPEPRRGLVEIDMGVAQVSAPRGLPLKNRRADAWPVSMGNPHRVMFEEGDPLRLAEEFGPVLCRAENANIEFAVRTGPQRYEVAVYERGAGLTQACGTGACAVAAAAVARGEASRNEPITVKLPGGELTLRIDAGNRVRMRGPAELVFVGEL